MSMIFSFFIPCMLISGYDLCLSSFDSRNNDPQWTLRNHKQIRRRRFHTK